MSTARKLVNDSTPKARRKKPKTADIILLPSALGGGEAHRAREMETQDGPEGLLNALDKALALWFGCESGEGRIEHNLVETEAFRPGMDFCAEIHVEGVPVYEVINFSGFRARGNVTAYLPASVAEKAVALRQIAEAQKATGKHQDFTGYVKFEDGEVSMTSEVSEMDEDSLEYFGLAPARPVEVVPQKPKRAHQTYAERKRRRSDREAEELKDRLDYIRANYEGRIEFTWPYIGSVLLEKEKGDANLAAYRSSATFKVGDRYLGPIIRPGDELEFLSIDALPEGASLPLYSVVLAWRPCIGRLAPAIVYEVVDGEPHITWDLFRVGRDDDEVGPLSLFRVVGYCVQHRFNIDEARGAFHYTWDTEGKPVPVLPSEGVTPAGGVRYPHGIPFTEVA